VQSSIDGQKQKRKSAREAKTIVAKTQAYNSRYMRRPEARPWPFEVFDYID